MADGVAKLTPHHLLGVTMLWAPCLECDHQLHKVAHICYTMPPLLFKSQGDVRPVIHSPSILSRAGALGTLAGQG